MALKDIIKDISSVSSYKSFKEFYGGGVYDTDIAPLSDEELKQKFPDIYNQYYGEQEQSKGIVAKFIDAVKEKAKDSIEYFTKTPPQEILKDAVDVPVSLFEGLNIGLKRATSTIDRLLLGTSFDKELVSEIQKQKGLSPEEINKEEEELKKKKKPAQRLVFDLSKWLAPQLVTDVATAGLGVSTYLPALLGMAPSIVQKLASSKAILTGLDFVKDTQLLYNPAEHEGRDDLEARVKDGVENFTAGLAFYGGAKVVKKVASPIFKTLWEAVTYPMRLTEKAINEKKIKITEDFLKQNAGAFWGITSRLEEIPTKEIVSVLKGEKAITDEVRDFFTTPEWQNVIKKYGADFKKYPEVIRIRKSLLEPLKTVIEGQKPTTEIKELKGLLPENVLFKKLEEAFIKDADSFSSPDYILKDAVEGKIPFEELNKVVKELEGKGYKVDRNKIIETIANFIKNKREIEDWQLAVMENEIYSQQYDFISEYEKPLKLYKKIYNLLFEKKPDLTKIGEAYNKAAKKLGYPALDEIAEDLRSRGIDIPVGDFEAGLLELVESIGGKRRVGKPPKEYDYLKDLLSAIKPSGAEQVEAPYRVAKSELEKIVNVKKNIALGKEEEAKNVVEKIKDNVVKEGLKEELNFFKKDVGEILNNTQGKPFKLSMPQIEAIFGKYSPNKINEATISFVNALNNKNTPLDELVYSLNNTLKEVIKSQANTLNYFNLAEAEKSPIKEALVKIFSPFRYTTSLALGFSGTPQSKQILALAENWRITQENIGFVFERFINFIKDNSFLTERLNDIFDMVKKNGDDVLKEGFVDSRFTLEEMGKIKEYIRATKEILNTINIFRVITRRAPIPERTDYVAPHRLADFILNALAEKKDVLKPDVRMYFKRELDNLGFGGIFSNDLELAWRSYIRVARRLISKYQYEFLTTQSGITNGILDETTEQILSRWRYAAGAQPRDTIVSEMLRFFGGIGDLFKGFSNYFAEKFLGKERYIRVNVDERLLNELGMTENLKNFFPEVFERGYFEYSKDVVKESTQNLSSVGKSLVYALTLGMNANFTILNSFQEYIVGAPIIGAKDVIKGYGKTILNPALKIFGKGFDAKKLENLGKFYDLIGRGQTVFMDDREIILNPLLKLMTLNISLTEEKLIRPSGIQAFLSHIKDIPISPELKERMAVEFSKEINFVSSKLYKPTLARIPGVGILFMFTQYPDNYLSRLELAIKMALSDKEAVDFYKYLLTKANASREEFDLFLKEIASRRDPSLWSKAVRAGNLGLILASILIGGKIIGDLMFDAANMVSTKVGLSKEPMDKEEYEKSKKAFSASFQEKVSPFSVLESSPIVAIPKAFVDSVSGEKSLEFNNVVYNYFKAGMDFLFKSPALAVAVFEGRDEEALALLDDMTTSFTETVTPVQLSRLIDAYDAYTKGYVLSRTRKGRIQYELEEGENPLQVFLFGRGQLRGYQELKTLKEKVNEATKLRNQAWEYYERYLETDDDKYYTLFEKAKRELEDRFGERISLLDLIRRRKEFRKRLTSPERLIKSQPKEIRRSLMETAEEEAGRDYLERLLNLK